MLTFAWYLLALAPVVAVAYLVWAYRKKTSARAAASKERYAQLFDAAPPRPHAPDVAAPAVPTPTAGLASPHVSALRASNAYAPRAQLLNVQQARLRDLLVSGLPDHEVFAQVSLTAVLEVAGLPDGREREQRVRALAQQTVDCVVCTQALAVVAIVDLDSGSTPEARFKLEVLKAAGVRYLQWNPLEPPPEGDLAAWIGEK